MTNEQLRVEDLARTADVSVDTIRFYQKRRLLPPPTRDGRIAWYGPEHVDRLGRIRDLQHRGFSLAVIRRLLDGELDPADEPLAAAVVGDDEVLTLPELLALGRRHTEMTRAVAEDAVAMFDTYVREPLRETELSDAERAEQLVDAFRTLLPTVTTLVAQHFRAVLLEVAQEHLESVGEVAELSAASGEPDWTAS